MKAELASGEVVTLQKDCNCVTHNDPHWTYMDRLSRRLNRAILYTPDGTLRRSLFAAHGFAIEEEARCAQKLRDMQRCGIVRLIPEESDEMTDLQRGQLEQNRQALLADHHARQHAASVHGTPLRDIARHFMAAVDEAFAGTRFAQTLQRDAVREKAKAAL